MPTVIVSIDGTIIKEVDLLKARTSLGRRPYNDIVIDNLAVSGEHCAFVLKGGDVFLEDLNSTNGTYVNGKVVKSHLLQKGDTIEIGKFTLKLIHRSTRDALKASPGFQPEASDENLTVAPPSEFSASQSFAPSGMPPAVIRVLSGASTGREVPLTKVVTTVGKPGVAVASISRRRHGYVVAQVDGTNPLLLNGVPVGDSPVALSNGDQLELAETQMQFILV